MKHVRLLLFVFIIILFDNCTSTAPIQGRYAIVYWGIAGEEFKLDPQTSKFDFISRTEGIIREYSAGTWTRNKKTVFLNGFEYNNIKVLEVENKIEEDPNASGNKIVVQYQDDPLDTFIKVDLIINERFKVRIPGDTTFYTESDIRMLQVRTYLGYEGFLLGAPPKIDTLYSPTLEVSNRSNNHKVALLSFKVDWKDFYRVKLTDTLTVKNNRTLLWGKSALKKVKE